MKNKTSKQKKANSPMDAALSYLGYRARTVREIERYLDEKQYGEYEIYQVVEKLKEYGYIDDAKYARDFISSRLRVKPVSRRKLMQDLSLHEIDRELIEESLAAVTDEIESENAYMVAVKYYDSYNGTEANERRQILLRRIVSRGFDYGTAKAAVERIEEERSNDSTL